MRIKMLMASLILISTSSLGAVPLGMNYQGYLTDRNGAALSDELLVSFSIYASEFGGSPLWNDTLVVDVENGLFSVQLGRAVNPFPTGLFDTALWIGITVEADMEMIPRRALTSVGFSFKAEDAESVQGKSAFQLDQSGHVDDLANPHVVTATQVGAADESSLHAHTSDTGNPHLTTATQTGALNAGVFSAHASDESEHHVRYNDTESVAAMLAADGSGSGLDADTVDGVDGGSLQASVTENTENIANNAAAIAQNAGDIAATRGLYKVTADGEEIGIVGPSGGYPFLPSPPLEVVSNRGYYFNVSHIFPDEGSFRFVLSIEYESTDCTGQPYTPYDGGIIARYGRVGKTANPIDSQVYYLPRDAVPVMVAIRSRWTNPCVPYEPGLQEKYRLLINDEAITGVPSVTSFPAPIRIVPPDF